MVFVPVWGQGRPEARHAGGMGIEIANGTAQRLVRERTNALIQVRSADLAALSGRWMRPPPGSRISKRVMMKCLTWRRGRSPGQAWSPA